MARYMADRGEDTLFVSGTLEALVPETSVARSIWSAVASLDCSALDSGYRNDAMGRLAVDPRRLLAVWMLGLLRGVTSSTRLAQVCASDVEFRWLLGDASVHKSTLCAFRTAQSGSLAGLSAQVLAGLGRAGLLPGESVAVDGTVIRAAASCRSVCARKPLRKRVERLERVIEETLERAEGGEAEVEVFEKRKARLAQALEEMDALGLDRDADRLTLSEPEVKLRRLKDGGFGPGHNVQVASDASSGAIVHAEVVDRGNDSGQLEPQLEQAEDALRQAHRATQSPVRSVVADSAYHDHKQLNALESRGVACFVPDTAKAHRRPPRIHPDYRAHAFTYDEATDTLRCPQGQNLHRRKLNPSQTSVVYQAPASVCAACPARSDCCPKTRGGRNVNRPLHGAVLERIARRVASEPGHRMKRVRHVVAEGAFARLTGLLHWPRCRSWGVQGIRAELALRVLTHNLMLLTGHWKPLVLPAEPTTP